MSDRAEQIACAVAERLRKGYSAKLAAGSHCLDADGRLKRWIGKKWGVSPRRAREYIAIARRQIQSLDLLAGREEEVVSADSPTHEWEERGGGATLSVESSVPYTQQEFIEAAKVDSSIWEVEKYQVTRYEQGAKIDGRILKTPLWRIYASFVRISPLVFKWPVVQPVDISLFVPPAARKVKATPLRTALVFSDLHVGFRWKDGRKFLDPLHDRRALDLVCQMAEESRPDLIVLLGDGLDFTELTDKFFVSPEFAETIQPAVCELGGYWLPRLRRTCQEFVYIEGNHEVRLDKSVATNLRAACGLRAADAMGGPPLLSVPALLGLSRLGIQYSAGYPHSKWKINDNLWAVHGDTVGKDAVRRRLRHIAHSEIMAHTHTMEMSSVTVERASGIKQYEVVSCGTLGRLQPGVIPAAKMDPEWQQGFNFVYFQPGNGFFQIIPIRLYDGHSVAFGRMWCGSDPVKDIAKVTGIECMLSTK